VPWGEKFPRLKNNQPDKPMKKSNTILTLMALSAASAFAGVEPAPAPSGKGAVSPPPVDPCAGPISYNNFELLYANTDFGGYYDSGSEDGLQGKVEISPWKHIYFTGGFTWSDTDAGDAWSVSGGIGGYIPLTDNIHLAADAGFNYVERDQSYVYVNPLGGGGGKIEDYYDGSDSDTGWYVRPHIRAKWSCFEVHTGFIYADTDTGGGYIGELDGEDYFDEGSSDDWAWFIQAYYQVAQGWDITAGYTSWDETEADTWTIGARYKW
jgi:hypothetical protein